MAASIYVVAFVVIACHRGVHVSHDRAVPAVRVCVWEDFSAQRIISIEDQITWPWFLNILATESSVRFGEPCILTARFSLLRPLEEIVFVCFEIVYLSERPNRFRGVDTWGNAARNWIANFLWHGCKRTHLKRRREKDGSLKMSQLRIMIRETIRMRSDKCYMR